MKTHKHQAMYEVCTCGAIREAGGEWEEGGGKNAAAQALAVQRMRLTTPEERSESALLAASKRWKGTTKKQRSQYMRDIASLPRPSRYSQDRCPCGKFTKDRARKRNHKCAAA